MENIFDKANLFLCRLKFSKKLLAYLFIIAFAISLIPIVVTAFYAVPISDDYSFGFFTHKAVTEGGSFFKAIIESNHTFYNSWQGFYSSNILASMQLFNINVELYWVWLVFVMFVILFSSFYFAKAVLHNVLGFSFTDTVLVSVPLLFSFIQFFPSMAEGFYWMDGTLSTFINFIMLLIFGFVINYARSQSKVGKTVYFTLSVTAMLIISGTSLITYLTVMLIFGMALIYSFVKKYNCKAILITLMCIYTTGMIVALIAPGNAVRLAQNESTGTVGFSLIKSVIYALGYSVILFGRWSTLCIMAVLVFVSVIAYPALKKSKYQFKNPLLVFIISYCVYAARMSVQLFAGGYIGAPRQYNQYFLGFILMLAVSCLYFTGWLSKKLPVTVATGKKHNTKLITEKKISLTFLVIIAVLFVSGTFAFHVKKMSSVSTAMSLISGETQVYSKEMHKRISLYEDKSIKDVVVSPLSAQPYCFADDTVTDYPAYWTNASIARYYGKNSVIREEKARIDDEGKH